MSAESDKIYLKLLIIANNLEVHVKEDECGITDVLCSCVCVCVCVRACKCQCNIKYTDM